MPMNPERAVREHQRLANRLRASELQRAAALAATLETCTAFEPCRSAACPRCGVAYQAAMVGAVDHLIRTPARAIRDRMTATTIVPATGCHAPGDQSVEVLGSAPRIRGPPAPDLKVIPLLSIRRTHRRKPM